MRRSAAMVLSLALTATTAMAQTYEPASYKVGGEQSVMFEWLIGTVFLIGCLVVAFKPARRSNLK